MYPIVKIIELKRNEGIATALNLAVDYFRNIKDIEWIITMDQDSFLLDSVIRNISLETLEYLGDTRVAAFGLNYEDFHFTKRKLVNNLKKPLYVDFLITSGCIVRKEVIENYKFDAYLFMYNVDTDFCRRLRRDHLKLVLLSTSFMFHKGGIIDMYDDNKEYHYNEPEKFYFFGRNFLIMLKRYFDLKGLVYLLLLLMENIIANRDIPHTFSNLKRGLADGLHYILSK
jgi:GT2 family glycosyltransferase